MVATRKTNGTNSSSKKQKEVFFMSSILLVSLLGISFWKPEYAIIPISLIGVTCMREFVLMRNAWLEKSKLSKSQSKQIFTESSATTESQMESEGGEEVVIRRKTTSVSTGPALIDENDQWESGDEKEVVVEEEISEITSPVTYSSQAGGGLPLLPFSSESLFQLYLRCLLCLAFIMVSYYCYLSNALGRMESIAYYAISSVTLLVVLWLGSLFEIFESGVMYPKLRYLNNENKFRKKSSRLNWISFAMDYIGTLVIGGGLGFLFLMTVQSRIYAIAFMICCLISCSNVGEWIWDSIGIATGTKIDPFIDDSKTVQGFFLNIGFTCLVGSWIKIALDLLYEYHLLFHDFRIMNQSFREYCLASCIIAFITYMATLTFQEFQRSFKFSPQLPSMKEDQLIEYKENEPRMLNMMAPILCTVPFGYTALMVLL